MAYLLDTNICIYLINKKNYKLIDKFEEIDKENINISAITVSELEYGITKSQYPIKNRLNLNKFLVPLNILPYTDNSAKIYGEIRAFLERKGQIIGAMDLLIAAHALSLNLTLITNNEKEFKRIPSLKVENWV
ncbi:twitching motility protein PilT [Candidatus Peregrinibacteria bacterium RIFOXYB2_FULL_32_7]|nr:MAG: twitching motility protein PilT [Candidatus Peregrinibacteria bacterium RIFOXYB2_FULL_32_7]